eukprot:g30356.t1
MATNINHFVNAYGKGQNANIIPGQKCKYWKERCMLTMGKGDKHHGNHPPTHDHSASHSSNKNQPPPYHQQPPNHNQQPPNHNQQPYDYNHQPPNYNQQPPNYNLQQPNYNQQPPNYKQQPPHYNHHNQPPDPSHGYPHNYPHNNNTYSSPHRALLRYHALVAQQHADRLRADIRNNFISQITGYYSHQHQ